jgi:putative radical SAM enzyme (TIGR03279 family)
MVRVARVHPGSIAEELGIVPGTELLTVNERGVEDFLDWEFLTADDEIVVEARLPDGDEAVYEIDRSEGESLGLELEPPNIRRCANRCEFCFIEGLPKGLRKQLYIRDDDYRLSFAYGNFATLSNLKDRDIARILEYRLSPLYVSVHATPWDVRKKLLNNPRVPNILEQLQRLVDGGIQFHGQMVVVPGMNDGAVLEQSLQDLWGFGDACLSVAVVPVGLTQFNHLYKGETMSREHAARLLEVTDRWADRGRAERGEAGVFGSDELYLLAGAALPSAEHYGEFAQVENGVGAVTKLRQQIAEGIGSLPRLDGRRIGVVTGRAMRDVMPGILHDLREATGASFEMILATNSLFGPAVTTSGLLVGADFRRELSGRTDFDLVMIPAESINDDGLFLDEDSFDALKASLPVPLIPSYDFVDVLQGESANDVLAGAAS